MHRHGTIRVVCETYGTQVLGIRPDDRCLSAAKAFFAYGLGNSVLFPLVGRGGRGARPGAVAPGRRSSSAAAEVRRDAVLRRPDVLRQHAARPSCRPTRSRACGWRRRPARPLPAALYQRLDDALRRRHPRRHRHDRDAAHLPVQPAGQVRPGTTGVAVPGYDLRILDEDGPRGRRTARRARCSSAATRPPPGTGPATTRPAQVFQGEWLRTGDTYVAGRGRLLRLPRPHRRHAQGQRDLGLARPRSRGGCSRTTPSPRRSSSRRPTRTGWRSRSPTSCCGRRATVDRGRADRVLPRRAAVVQAAAQGDVRRRLPDHRDRQDPPRRAARDGGRRCSTATAPGGRECA